MDFQVQTVLSVSAVVGLLLAALQLMAGWRLRQPCLFVWALANLFLTVACVFLAGRRELGLGASVLVGNGCVLTGMGLIYSGIRVLDERPPGLLAVATVALLGTALLALSLRTGDNIADRAAIVSILVAGWSATAGRALLVTPGGGPIVSRVASAILLIVIATAYTFRAIGVQFGLLPLPGHGSPIEVAIAILGLALAICWTFGSLFMVLEKVASLDDLTGLLNRRATLQRAAELLRSARTRRQPFSLLLADLDHFKAVNDRFGHDTGDIALQRFAELVPQCIRPNDVAGRYGGEEFCILLPAADALGAHGAGERLRLLVEERLREVNGRAIGVTLTIGAATYLPGERPDTIADLIAAADAALYSGKATGRNRTVLAKAVVGEASAGRCEAPGAGAIAAEPLH